MNPKYPLVLTLLSLSGCAGTPRILSVRSDPADAEVCIKGRPGSKFAGARKACIGSTPLEADRVTVTNESGEKHVVEFKDLDREEDSFYLVVSRAGYAPQSMMVPGWSHFVTLRQETTAHESAPAPAAAPLAAKATAKLTSDPVGALVYVNDYLKGNTPYVLEGDSGQTVRIKVEQAGYEPIERSITLESGRGMDINLTMERASAVAKDEAGEEERALASTDDDGE